ncbi:unnamed protein product [Sympodiomycopsis kandeliae]
MSPTTYFLHRSRAAFGFAALVVLGLTWYTLHRGLGLELTNSKLLRHLDPHPNHHFNEDVVLTYKTGSTVLFNRVPIWLLDLSRARNSPPCHRHGWAEYIPNQAFYSDAEMTLGDITFQDVLSNVSEYVKSMDDFQEYYRIHQALTQRVDPAILPKPNTQIPVSKGWKLDKFKFLPLHGDAYRRWPNAKWQVAIEDDTFLFWNQLMKWLKTQDHDSHRLFGNPTILVNGSLPFAHGGSAYAISRGLLKSTYGTDPWNFEHQWDHWVRYSCCGDAELSRAFRLSTNSTSIPNFEISRFKFQSESIGKIKFDARDLCEPIFSLHHVTPFEYSQLQKFKETLDIRVGPDDFIRYIDLLDWMMPIFLRHKIHTGLADFANRGDEVRKTYVSKIEWLHRIDWRAILNDVMPATPGISDLAQCIRACEEKATCLIYTFDKVSKECRISDNLYVGTTDTENDRFTSGYQLSRINLLRNTQWCAGRLGDLGVLSMQDIGPSLNAIGKGNGIESPTDGYR